MSDAHLWCFLRGVEPTKRTCGPSVNNHLGTLNHGRHWRHVSTRHWCCFMDGVEPTKAIVDHLRITIWAHKIIRGFVDMCPLALVVSCEWCGACQSKCTLSLINHLGSLNHRRH